MPRALAIGAMDCSSARACATTPLRDSSGERSGHEAPPGEDEPYASGVMKLGSPDP
jgi:hypothetical protein